MFWNRKKQEKQDEETAQTLIDFAEELNSPFVAYRLLWRFLLINIIIWLLVLLFPNFFVRLFEILGNGKLSMVLLGVPFGFGLYLAYIIFRIKIPDVEENKTLNSDLMGSLDYQTASNKRYFVWTLSILAGVLNIVFITIICFILDSKRLYLFDF